MKHSYICITKLFGKSVTAESWNNLGQTITVMYSKN